MKIKVCIKARTFETITIPKMNFCEIHNFLNNKYGLKGWTGYEYAI